VVVVVVIVVVVVVVVVEAVVVVVVVVAVVVAVVGVVKYTSVEMDFPSADNICDSLASQWGGYVCTNNTF